MEDPMLKAIRGTPEGGSCMPEYQEDLRRRIFGSNPPISLANAITRERNYHLLQAAAVMFVDPLLKCNSDARPRICVDSAIALLTEIESRNEKENTR